MKKYELTNDAIQHGSQTLYRIKALRDIPLYDVKAGDLGGYIQKETNLSHDDNCWVGGNAKVWGNAKVYGSARVSDNAKVFGNVCVYHYAQVCDNAGVGGNAKVYGSARVSDNAKVFGNVCVYHYAQVFGTAWVFGKARVCGKAWVSGNMQLNSGKHTGEETEQDDNNKRTKQKDVFTSLTHGIVKNTDEGWQNLPDDKAYPILLTKTDGSNPVVVEQRYMLQWVYECGHKEPINEGDKWYSHTHVSKIFNG